jgi:hypothetical protein
MGSALHRQFEEWRLRQARVACLDLSKEDCADFENTQKIHRPINIVQRMGLGVWCEFCKQKRQQRVFPPFGDAIRLRDPD